jgi:DNA-binding MltR family transcriptional regulator
MTLTQELKTYSFTDDEQIDFILDIITNNSEYEDDEELGQWMKELSRQIEDQIVNHMENEGL